jgi:hypothetical protein
LRPWCSPLSGHVLFESRKPLFQILRLEGLALALEQGRNAARLLDRQLTPPNARNDLAEGLDDAAGNG